MSIDTPDQFVQSPAVVAHALDGDIVIMHRVTGKYFGLDAVGGAIWQLLAQPRRPAEICAALLDEFDVEETRCRQEVDRYLAQMLSAQLVQPVDAV